ncbi:alanine racemase [Pseudemcibacter aquimaris]|uniref:alanine racemase n=1 Tax=Pseudemcibacter aquimaris TaxID=2857064 RepID=UPI00201349CC|nr:alanine racemase [Pseudemcibacter aquimaris]MCC3860762.1 alanine racemase [Pseudemcibacter aquimaris]WDU59580.1 alanine racemase [Pseudemcibacter aquimaris]
MNISRRNLLNAAVVGTAATTLPLSSANAHTPPNKAIHSSFDPWIEIRPDHVKHNIAEISRLVEGRPIMAVIKNNAYGMGIVNMGRILDDEASVSGLAVVKLSEAIELRDAGVKKPILLMGTFDEKGLEELIMRDITPMIYTPVGDALERIAAKKGTSVKITICVDTGMGRVGVPFREAADLIRDLASRPSIEIVSTMTGLNEIPDYEKMQIARLRDIQSELESDGISLGLIHAASSYSLFQSPYSYLDMVRPGMAIFGQYSSPKFKEQGLMDLKPTMALKARVVYVKKLLKGESAGYEKAYTADKDTWIATIPAGHVDGVPRAAANGGWVRIGDTNYPVIASVSASHTLVEIGPEEAVKAGDEATFFDWRDGSRPEDASAASGASVYDMIMHLNPTLPKRIV